MNNRTLIGLIISIIALLISAYVPELSDNFDTLAPAITVFMVAIAIGTPLTTALQGFVASREFYSVANDRLAEFEKHAQTTDTPIDDIATQIARAILNAISEHDTPQSSSVETKEGTFTVVAIDD